MTPSRQPISSERPNGIVGPLADRTALVTGAAGDIGRMVARRLASTGAALALADLDRAADGLEAAAEQCRSDGASRVLTTRFDVTDEDAVEAALDEVTAAIGPPDTVFNNAGYQGVFTPTPDYPVDDLRRVLDINVIGAFLVLRGSTARLRAAGRPGSVVSTASMAALGGPPNMAGYATSKAAVLGLTRTAATDLAPFGIRVNSLSPAFIGPGTMWDRQVELQAAASSPHFPDTVEEVAAAMVGQVPLGRYGSLAEVASAAVFLLSDEASYLTGFNLEVSGGI
jgi:NAD(P)-dependent dehydrogenase (short-subunit alcohol dehydrogenase family)